MIRDRVQFANDISDSIPIEEILVNYFDELMCVYDLIGDIEYKKITASAIDDTIEFQIRMCSESSANRVMSLLTMKPMVIKYGRVINFRVDKAGKDITIKI